MGLCQKWNVWKDTAKCFHPTCYQGPISSFFSDLFVYILDKGYSCQEFLGESELKLTNKAIRTSNGGWNSLVVEDTDSPMTSFPTVSANAARARRKNNRILATLPPLTKTLDKEVLDEMRKIIHR